MAKTRGKNPSSPVLRVRELVAFDEQIRLGGGVSAESVTPPPRNAEHYYYKKEGFLRDLCGETKRIKTMEIAGLDEAGRGALAGPVIVGCVHFSPVVFTAKDAEHYYYKKEGFLGDLCGEMKRTTLNALAGIDDSKRVSVKRREALFPRITAVSDWGIGYATPSEIDRVGIVPALTLAACRAYRAMRKRVDLLLLDRGLSLLSDLTIEPLRDLAIERLNHLQPRTPNHPISQSSDHSITQSLNFSPSLAVVHQR